MERDARGRVLDAVAVIPHLFPETPYLVVLPVESGASNDNLPLDPVPLRIHIDVYHRIEGSVKVVVRPVIEDGLAVADVIVDLLQAQQLLAQGEVVRKISRLIGGSPADESHIIDPAIAVPVIHVPPSRYLARIRPDSVEVNAE